MTTTLERRLGFGDAVTVGLGSMVGAGVFTVWSPAAEIAGSAILVSLLIAAIVALANATSSAQLAAVHPQAGGTYIYGRERLGPAAGHLAGWGFVVGKTASCAAMGLAVGAYLWPEQERVVAAIAILVVAAVNLAGITRTVQVTKVLLTMSSITLGLVLIAGWSSSQFDLGRIDVTAASPLEILRASGLMFFAFAGYARLATLGEEVRDPARTIPRAIPIALGLVFGLYLVVGATTVATVPVSTLAATDAPLHAVTTAGGWDWAAPLTRIGAGIAALGVLLPLIAGVARTTLAMARHREMPAVLSQIDTRRSTPWVAQILVAITAAVLASILGVRDALAVSGTGVLVYYLITNLAAMRLASHERRFWRGFPMVGAVGCTVLVATLPSRAALSGLGVLVAGVVLRWLTMTLRSSRDPMSSGERG